MPSVELLSNDEIDGRESKKESNRLNKSLLEDYLAMLHEQCKLATLHGLVTQLLGLELDKTRQLSFHTKGSGSS